MRNKKQKNPEKARKRKIITAVIIEIVVMIIGTLCVPLPLPWRLFVPIIIGAREIIKKAVQKLREPAPPALVHCCGATEPKPKTNKSNKTSRSKKK